MILRLAKRALGLRFVNRLGRFRSLADRILAQETRIGALPPEALRASMQALRARAQAGLSDAVIVECFALTREAARRALGEAPVAEQVLCGLALHDGAIADMKTGEGKTLAATLPCALHALAGQAVHVATPNDYLATRDADWMRPVYAALGLSVGVITQESDDEERRRAYACDITYGVASEFAFDYLRDHMKFSAAETVQRGHGFALVDEADAILIDEASMPLSLFGPLVDQSPFYRALDAIVAALPEAACTIERNRHVTLTETGYAAAERALRAAALLKPRQSLHDVGAVSLLHHLTQALRARRLLQRDRDYIVDGEAIVIIDRHSGRMMPDRRYDDGLHQALEAKEGCPISEDVGTLSSITFQTYFSLYDRLAGMTGTAAGNEDEYRAVYGLDVVRIPTHRPVIRSDASIMHRTQAEKFAAILAAVNDAQGRRQPVLIGAPSIAASEALAALLEADGWRRGAAAGEKTFAVLNAKHHADEARIIAEAGLPGAVTIATAMAGRGTDIRLGGPDAEAARRAAVVAAGGLLVIGTEHYEHRRFDAQLRGRAGRQGDPGQTVFHASLEDDLFRESEAPLPAGNEMLKPAVAERLVARAQRRNETRRFNDRLNLLRFDATIQRQRQAVFAQRCAIRDTDAVLEEVCVFRESAIDEIVQRFAPGHQPWDSATLDDAIRKVLTLAVPLDDVAQDAAGGAALRARISGMAERWMADKIAAIGAEAIGEILRRIMLALIDQFWIEQTERLEHLKAIIRDRRLQPHQTHAAFEIEAFALFDTMQSDLRSAVTSHAMRLGLRSP